jgi:hypothetical protein
MPYADTTTKGGLSAAPRSRFPESGSLAGLAGSGLFSLLLAARLTLALARRRCLVASFRSGFEGLVVNLFESSLRLGLLALDRGQLLVVGLFRLALALTEGTLLLLGAVTLDSLLGRDRARGRAKRCVVVADDLIQREGDASETTGPAYLSDLSVQGRLAAVSTGGVATLDVEVGLPRLLVIRVRRLDTVDRGQGIGGVAADILDLPGAKALPACADAVCVAIDELRH